MLWFQYIPGDRIKEEMRNVDVLSEDRLNELLQSFLNDFKERKLEENGWPTSICAYKVSKVAVSAYTRILAKKYPNICINCVHPGVVKTDMNCNTGELPVEEGAQRPVEIRVAVVDLLLFDSEKELAADGVWKVPLLVGADATVVVHKEDGLV
ncbi:hypothetical protein BHE74_00033744 [Ensete ventricosum]|nr:hypothetical protein BHE74_00033744 [Ensete ventricosum]